MASVRPFHRYRGETSFTMRQFIEILREQIPQVAPKQVKYRVTMIPSDRTIRFYTANNIVDKPTGKDGAQALYGYRHLLQVLSIKYLQSQYLPLVKIRSLVENASNRDLELIIPEISTVTATHRGIAREDRKIVDNSFLPQAIDFKSSQEISRIPAVDTDRDADVVHSFWQRVEIAPGIELHIHASALAEQQIEQLRGALLREIGVLRGWFGDGGK